MKSIVIAAFVSVFLFSRVAMADGLIVVPQPPGGPIQQLGVKYHRVACVIDNQVAKTTIDQVFTNPNARQLEGTYIFPLPTDAVVKDFSMFMNGKEVKGEVLDKDKALKIYQEIVSKMRDPGLLEYAGRAMYKARVFPIPAKGEIRTKISYTQTLIADNKLVRYVYPLNTEKYSSTLLDSVVISVRIKSKHPIKNVYSPSHVVDTHRPNDHEAVVGFEQNKVKPDRDFTLYYAIDDKDVGLNLLTRRAAGEDGYFMMLISPRQEIDKVSKKDITLVLDTSGSMVSDGDKLSQAKKALRFCLRNLNKGDRFNIVRFATEGSRYADTMIPATKENVEKAIEHVNQFDARGGTHIEEALTLALQTNRGADPPPHMILFLTDGQPTLGETDPTKIVAAVKVLNKAPDGGKAARLFAFGVGFDVNTHLLDGLAAATKAVSEYVTPKEDIELKVSSLYGKIASPVLSDVSIGVGKKVKISDVYPKALPDVFKGTQIAVFGRYNGAGHAAITLEGKTDEGKKSYTYEASFAEKSSAATHIPTLWAHHKIAYLLDEIRRNGDTPEVREEVVRLSKQFGIVTPYTSIIVLEDGDPRVAAARRTDAFEDRDRRSRLFDALREQAGQAEGAPAAELAARSGARAVDVAEKLKSITSVGGKVGGPIRGLEGKADEDFAALGRLAALYHRRIDNRSFFQGRDGTWVEVGLKEEEIAKAVVMEAMSEEYFNLLRARPELGQIMSLGQKVMFRDGDTVLGFK